MIFFSGFALGFIFSSLPGPAGMSVLTARSRKTALECLGYLMLGDLLVLFLCALIYFGLNSSLEGIPLKTLAALFLIGYSLFAGFRMNWERQADSHKSFWLSLASPGLWLGNFGVLSLGGAQSAVEMLLLILGLQMGMISWFAALLFWLSKQSLRGQYRFYRLCLGLMFLTGLSSFFL